MCLILRLETDWWSISETTNFIKTDLSQTKESVLGEKMEANNRTRVSMETHPVNTTRCYEDEDGRIYAVFRYAGNGFRVRATGVKMRLSASIPNGQLDTHLTATKQSTGKPTNFPIYLLV